jgi:hypothetical protein
VDETDNCVSGQSGGLRLEVPQNASTCHNGGLHQGVPLMIEPFTHTHFVGYSSVVIVILDGPPRDFDDHVSRSHDDALPTAVLSDLCGIIYKPAGLFDSALLQPCFRSSSLAIPSRTMAHQPAMQQVRKIPVSSSGHAFQVSLTQLMADEIDPSKDDIWPKRMAEYGYTFRIYSGTTRYSRPTGLHCSESDYHQGGGEIGSRFLGRIFH